MEVIQLPKFVMEKEDNLVLYRLQLLSVLANRLTTSRVEPDLTVPTLKVLAYLRPLPGVSYLNDLQDKLKDLVFHLHLKNEKTNKMASLDLSEAKDDFFPREMSDNFTKLLNLQVLLKKEHRSCVELFESYALDLFRKRNNGHFEAVQKIIDSKKASLIDREQILRNQLENLSIQFAILVEKHIKKAVRSLRYDLKKLANSSDAPSEIVDSLQVIRPDNVSHQIYQEACDTYTYPSRPQFSSSSLQGRLSQDVPLNCKGNKEASEYLHNLIYCPDCKGPVPASASTGSCERDGFTVPDNINSNFNASVLLAAHQAQYAKALKPYRPLSGRSLRLHKGDILKTKLESSGGEWRFGFKKTGFGLKKTWGFFRTAVVAK